MGAYEHESSLAIGVDPGQIVFTLPQGQTSPEVKTLLIWSANIGTLHWTLSGIPAWLQADPTQGESTGEVDTVTLTNSAIGLAHGTYSAALLVSDPLAFNSPVTVSVTLRVIRQLYVPAEYPTIQAAIDAAIPPADVVVADGIYVGTGNKNPDFQGKAITVRSASGNPNACSIDCQNLGRGFYFHSNEGSFSVVDGLGIRNGSVTSSDPGGAYGGGVYCSSSSPTLANCAISGNSAAYGGGVYFYSSSPTLTNCAINGNTANDGAGVCCWGLCSPTLTNCTISNNTGTTGNYTDGGGLFCSGAGPTLTYCVIDGNSATRGGGVGCWGSSSRPTLTHCTISGNNASFGGGAYLDGSSPTLTNCAISGNSASSGGGVFCSGSSPMLTNCLINENTAYYRGGLNCNTSSFPLLTNCTIADNTADSEGSAVWSSSSIPTLTNCLLWGNSNPAITAGGSLPITHSAVQGGYTGTGNINLNPLFVDADGADNNPGTWQDNDYRLAAHSPCIDAGNNASVPVSVTTDLTGRPRFVDDPTSSDCPYVPDTCGTAPIVDMGAYEFRLPVPGDLDGDGDVDGADFTVFLAAFGRCSGSPHFNPAADLDGDGCVTLVDYQQWLQFYRDFNGIPTAGLPRPTDVGDVNADGLVNGADVQPFVRVLLEPTAATLREGCVTDFNGDGRSDEADVAGFVDLLVGGE